MNSEFLEREPDATPTILTVGQLNRAVARLIERGFPLLWVKGEISNFTRATSGHWYFSLKDRDAQVRCVMFRGRNQALDWTPREGDSVEARAIAGLYEARGEFQLNVENLRRAGAGTLFEEFLKLKAKLEAEGLFDAARKRELPESPRAIGVITSLQAAALRDVLTTIRRRAPHLAVIIYPTPVQGRDAAPRITAAVRIAGERALRLNETQLLLLVRGGGSIEDLWSFNDEALARALVDSPIPVVSGVGHETDFTIADFAADIRAPTPTAAAELAAPDRELLMEQVLVRSLALHRYLHRNFAQKAQRVDELAVRLKSPAQRLTERKLRLAELGLRLGRAERASLSRADQRFAFVSAALYRARPDMTARERQLAGLAQRLIAASTAIRTAWRVRAELAAARLALLDPHAPLGRGYALVTDARARLVRQATDLLVGERVRLEFASGAALARVDELEAQKPDSAQGN